MGAAAYACPKCGKTWRPPEAVAPAAPVIKPHSGRSSRVWPVVRALLVLAAISAIPVGGWILAKRSASHGGGEVAPGSNIVFPKEITGPMLSVPANEIAGTPFTISPPGEKVVAYVELISGGEGTIRVMTANQFDGAKANWGKGIVTEYWYLKGFTQITRGKVRRYASDAAMPPGRYVLAVIGGAQESSTRIQIGTER